MLNSKDQAQQHQGQDKEMKVIKRNGEYEEVSFDKILHRVKKVGSQATPPLTINYSQLVMKVIDQLYDNIPTHIIDELTAEQCASMLHKTHRLFYFG